MSSPAGHREEVVKRNVFRVAITLLAVTTSAFGQAPSQPPPSYRFSSRGSALNIPVELVANGLVFVRAKVNGHEGSFILDNGSQGFTIDRDYASKIGLQASGSVAARGGGANAIDAGVIRNVEIGLPGLELTHRNLVVIDLKSLEPSVGHEVDGIIGTPRERRLPRSLAPALPTRRPRIRINEFLPHCLPELATTPRSGMVAQSKA